MTTAHPQLCPCAPDSLSELVHETYFVGLHGHEGHWHGSLRCPTCRAVLVRTPPTRWQSTARAMLHVAALRYEVAQPPALPPDDDEPPVLVQVPGLPPCRGAACDGLCDEPQCCGAPQPAAPATPLVVRRERALLREVKFMLAFPAVAALALVLSYCNPAR